jgi:hypothetical protein
MRFYFRLVKSKYNLSKSIIINITLLATLFIVGCEYSPTDIYFEDVPQKEPESLSININFEKDTIIILQPTYVYFTLDNQNLNIYNFSVVLNDENIIYTARKHNGFFYINPNHIPSDTYKMTITATTSTGTGSLSDVLGADQQTFTLEKTLIIDYLPPNPVQITTLEVVNGLLFMEWEKYTRPNFTHYRIEIYDVTDDNNHRLVENRIQINIQDSTSLFDTRFIGGKFRYRVFVFCSNVHQEVGGDYKYFEVKYPPLKIETTLDSITLTWPKCKLYNNFESYQLYVMNTYWGSLLFSSKDINDTVFVYKNGALGSVMQFDLKMFRKRNNSSTADLTFYSSTIFGEFFKMYNSFLPVSDNSALIMDQYNSNLDKIDLETMSLLATIDLPFVKLPRSYNYSCIYHSSFESDYLCFTKNKEILIHSNKTFKHISTLPFPENNIAPNIPFICTRIQLSNNNIMAFVMEFDTYDLIGLKKYVYLYDIDKGSYIDILEFDTGVYSTPSIALSSEGNYLYYVGYNTKRLYKIAEQSTALVGTVEARNFNIFNPLNDNELIILHPANNEILRLNAADLTEISRFTVESNPNSFYVDPVKGHIGVIANSNSTFFLVYNLSTGEQLFRKSASESSSYSMRLVDNTVYFSQFKINVL